MDRLDNLVLTVALRLGTIASLFVFCRPRRLMLTLLLVPILFVGCLALSSPAAAQVPAAAKHHQRDLTRIAQQEFGLDAPVALFAAQIHQESSWRNAARSSHAEGLAQFTPATAEWIAGHYPDLGEAMPYSPTWAMRAMLRYNRHIKARVKPWYARHVPECDRWAFALAGYNGGPGWISRDRRLAESSGLDPDRWWRHVEHCSARADWAFEENRQYVRRILLELEPRYISAGWRGRPTCP